MTLFITVEMHTSRAHLYTYSVICYQTTNDVIYVCIHYGSAVGDSIVRHVALFPCTPTITLNYDLWTCTCEFKLIKNLEMMLERIMIIYSISFMYVHVGVSCTYGVYTVDLQQCMTLCTCSCWCTCIYIWPCSGVDKVNLNMCGECWSA